MRIETIFAFIKFAVDEHATSFEAIEDMDWAALYDFALKHAIVGVLYDAIGRLPKDQRPEKKLLLKWYVLAERIKKRNEELNEGVIWVTRKFTEDGFPNCVLKGQGNALMYPDPTLRTPGDIDLWPLAERDQIYQYVRKDFPNTEMLYHHLEYPILKGIVTEVHFFPMFLNNPLYNRRFQKWNRKVGKEQCENWVKLGDSQFARPTAEFNVIYQLVHIRHHFFDEGIGLRQLMDYYYLLKDDQLAGKKEELQRLLKHFGLLDFAGALMYVMTVVFGLDQRYWLATPDETIGKMVMDEILMTGNFGHQDSRFGDLKKSSRTKRMSSLLQKNLRFTWYFPGEVCFAFLFRLCQPVWRWYAQMKYSH